MCCPVTAGQATEKVTPTLNTENFLTQSNVDFTQWLSQYAVEKGTPCTHTKIDGGLYNIPDDQLETLYQLLADHITAGRHSSLTQRHLPEISPVVIDIDFKFKTKPVTRLVTADLIEQIIKLYHHHYRQLGVTDNHLLTTFSLYRDEGYSTNKEYKDGFHLQMPYLVTNYQVHFEVRRRVISNLHPLKDVWFPDITNTLDEVVDNAVIKSNGWLLYGCNKPKLPPYQIRNLFVTSGVGSIERQLVDLKGSDSATLIALLSLRYMVDKKVTGITFVDTTRK